ncbi:CDP-diacylglycerol--serine O-phosphatidyltransferase [Endobacter medicaginis]|uniref:CDP-diacylglycerol--serine O-phosphatidyltransferase n=1 Tax=Endobacter medicaginis TaxID=1181271 RepID=A0A839UWI9_9PROT|nr:phosphatidylcholine/phosphatidylserine synthase [Endobacter medicaginis]MBB3174156.1 CDP-diacylglycerol--serine O-phosphatidyltransferase [Endobacter medicaginis]MCX5474200.1 phosphatidylcholine/phosphatidylserine synthase [Endobacter medicaginis]
MPNSERLTAARRRRRRLRRLRRRPDSRPRFKGQSFNRLIPNILTLIGLCAGLNGMRMAMDGEFGPAAVALLIAACIDGLDGRIARLLRATSRFGAEFDSLSDFFCFGVAPAFILYAWTLHETGPYGFLPCMMFAVCMGLRLARFNAGLGADEDRPAYAQNFFTGVPAPAGAGLAMFPIFLGLEARHQHLDWLWRVAHNPGLVALVLIGVAFLLVSTLPIWSFKNFKVPAAYVLPVLLGISAYVAVLVADPWAALAAAGLIYLVTIPFSRRSYHSLRRDADLLIEDAPEEPEPAG